MIDNNDIKLSLHIKNNQPVDLIDLTLGLNSFAKLYSSFAKGTDARLLVKQIKEGSIIVDLITTMYMSVVPLISDVNNILQFCEYLKLLTAILKGTNKEEINKIISDNYLQNPTIQDYKYFKDTLNITNNKNDTINIETINIKNNKIYNNCIIYGNEISEMKNNIDKIINDKREYKTMYNKQLFQWVQTNFDNSKKENKGNKGIISNIYREPLRIIFDNNIIQNEMTTSNNNIQWQDKYYIVDVEVLYNNDKPKVYKILKNYSEESFPID